ncbi:methylated-DNA--[protein]-cysteine S-methyltransferase [uncultured Sunxiuqinia sp.]|uniref:methylated-DNA--[protein]-cysteine S-methyltransferase n=1 Tax=uncultured Sunxiuqinia sp. TaxID=1573825 RepID=UPI00261850A4|nr:methylated-DNA--[protein]-cysteine S-methyltransferase [uncultured Sunxiuqinia sp.]
MSQSFTYPSPIGLIQIDCNSQAVSRIHFVEHECEKTDIEPELEDLIVRQLDDYFRGRLFHFNLPISPEGTDFQKKVWKELKTISYGQSVSYLELALRLGDKNLVRAVGNANSKNPLPIIVPCHRVIGSNKKLVGYAGGLWRKKWLLRHELEFRPYSNELF